MQEQSFHEAIRSGDRVARLVYADWLEEKGRDAEAALLRSGRWCLVPAGSFWMGGGGGRVGDTHVEIPHAFYLGAYPVTQGEWQDVMGSNPSYFSRNGEGKGKVRSVSDADLSLFPVEQITWGEVQRFIQKLNVGDKTGEWAYRLPTEAEWEYACRGAASSREDCSYHFYLDKPTNDLSASQANFDSAHPLGKGARGPCLQRTSKVGSYQPNRLGLYDMHGNVWEWCNDSERTERVLRGGSWASNLECQAEDRRWRTPWTRGNSMGCRLAYAIR